MRSYPWDPIVVFPEASHRVENELLLDGIGSILRRWDRICSLNQESVCPAPADSVYPCPQAKVQRLIFQVRVVHEVLTNGSIRAPYPRVITAA